MHKPDTNKFGFKKDKQMVWENVHNFEYVKYRLLHTNKITIE